MSASSAASAVSPSGYLNDGDKERVGDDDNDNNADNDSDASVDYLPSDYKPGENDSYHDTDDRNLIHYGRAAGPAEQRAVAAAVQRYYATAAAGDGVKACEQLVPVLARAVPSDYGGAAPSGSAGPAYLRAGRTCAAVISLLFEHYRAQLAAPVAVTGVRLSGGLAYALLGSKAAPASYIVLRRESRGWRIAQLLGAENTML